MFSRVSIICLKTKKPFEHHLFCNIKLDVNLFTPTIPIWNVLTELSLVMTSSDASHFTRCVMVAETAKMVPMKLIGANHRVDHVGCEDSCQELPKGKGRCVCTSKGYELSDDGRTCKDIDECQRYGACSQKCMNLPGSFQCSCHPGYVQDGKGCKAENQSAALLFFAGKTEIKGVHLHNMTAFTVTDNEEYAHQAIGIAFDALNSRVFWTDVVLHGGKSSITSSSINGTEISRLTISGLVMPEGLALDHVTRNIYFSESIGDYIGVCNVDTVNCTKLLPQGVWQPRELALYVPEGLLFTRIGAMSPGSAGWGWTEPTTSWSSRKTFIGPTASLSTTSSNVSFGLRPNTIVLNPLSSMGRTGGKLR